MPYSDSNSNKPKAKSHFLDNQGNMSTCWYFSLFLPCLIKRPERHGFDNSRVYHLLLSRAQLGDSSGPLHSHTNWASMLRTAGVYSTPSLFPRHRGFSHSMAVKNQPTFYMMEKFQDRKQKPPVILKSRPGICSVALDFLSAGRNKLQGLFWWKRRENRAFMEGAKCPHNGGTELMVVVLWSLSDTTKD